MAMIRRFSQLVAQQPKLAFGVSSLSAGSRKFSATIAESSRTSTSPPKIEVDYQAMDSKTTKANGNMTDTGMYNWRVAAVNNALAKRGKAVGPLTVEDLTSLGHLDQYHYMGTDACDELIEILGLGPDVKVLDIGSGIGGPARYLSMKSGCSVTGVELQHDLNEAAADLTERVGLADKVRYVTGDFVERYHAQDPGLRAKFDHMVSLLVILHVADRPKLLQASYDSIKSGGTFLIEDFALVGEGFSVKEDINLKTVVSANTVTSKADYIAELEAVGFVDIEVDDLSDSWRRWTAARYETYRASKEQTIKMHGEKLFNDRVAFYEVIDELFAGGNLGGVRVTGRKRGMAEEKLYRGRNSTRGTTTTAVLNELGSKVSE